MIDALIADGTHIEPGRQVSQRVLTSVGMRNAVASRYLPVPSVASRLPVEQCKGDGSSAPIVPQPAGIITSSRVLEPARHHSPTQGRRAWIKALTVYSKPVSKPTI